MQHELVLEKRVHQRRLSIVEVVFFDISFLLDDFYPITQKKAYRKSTRSK